jgi:acyl-CoA-binding protein
MAGGILPALRRIAIVCFLAAVAAAAGYAFSRKQKKRIKQGDENTSNNEEFETAVATISRGELNLSNEQQLKMYGLFKQSRCGVCDTSEPSMIDMVGHAKWMAWKAVGAISSAQAMDDYVKAVEKIEMMGAVGDIIGQPPAARPSGGGGVGRSVSMMQAPDANSAHEQEWNDEEQLFKFASNGNVQKLQEILASGGAQFLNKQDDMSQTALHLAADRGHVDAVTTLLSHGADINIQDEDGLTPLHTAVMCEHEDIVRVLLEGGADVSLEDIDGSTALASADAGPIKEILKAAEAEKGSGQ